MKQKKKNLSTEIIKDAIEKFCIDFYGFIPGYKRLPYKHCNGYYLTYFGHLLKPSYNASKVIVIKGQKNKGRLSAAGKRWKSGFVVDQFYKMENGKSKRFWIIPRSKLMYMIFKGWSRAKVKSHFFFPKDGNNNNLHIDNLVPYKDFMEGSRATYGVLESGSLSNREVIAIRKSKKTNKELAEKYGLNFHSISKIRNNRTYKNVEKIL